MAIDLDALALPDTGLVHQPDFDIFAWNSFIALNRPAVIPSPQNQWTRGYPDPKKGFVDAQSGDLAVWETFKEKREVFNFKDAGQLPPWSNPVDYGDLRAGDNVIKVPKNADGAHERIIHQAGKSHGSFDGLDETVEVASESLEVNYPNGNPNPIYRQVVGPRVWRGAPVPANAATDDNPVLFEVKVNYDFFQFVESNNYYVAEFFTDNSKNKTGVYVNTFTARDAVAGDIALPYRTSAKTGPRGQTTGPKGDPKVVDYSADKVASFFTNTAPAGAPPPLQGAVHLKAAWIAVTPEEAKNYHTTEATFYKSDANGKPVPVSATLGLVGVHIIQRVHVGDRGDAVADPRGGTFIFATFEHVDNDSGFTYANFFEQDTTPVPPGPTGFYPDVYGNRGQAEAPYPVQRRFPILSNPNPKDPAALGTAEVNEQVHQMISATNANSVWLNYRLTGTQFQAIDVTTQPFDPDSTRYPVSENDPTGIGQPIFLANLVVETNDGLQHFMGLPPMLPPNDGAPPGFTGSFPNLKYQRVGIEPNNGPVFNRDAANLSFTRKPINMGGCMGCHGVAQVRGYSMSFVLLGGYQGAGTDTQTAFDVAGAPPQPEPKDQ